MFYICLKQNRIIGMIKHHYAIITGDDIAPHPLVISAALPSEDAVVRISIVFIFLVTEFNGADDLLPTSALAEIKT